MSNAPAARNSKPCRRSMTAWPASRTGTCAQRLTGSTRNSREFRGARHTWSGDIFEHNRIRRVWKAVDEPASGYRTAHALAHRFACQLLVHVRPEWQNMAFRRDQPLLWRSSRFAWQRQCQLYKR